MKRFTLLSFVFGSFLLLFEGSPTSAVNNCIWGQFQCDSGRCVKYTFRCDKKDDCGDNSDEKGCGAECRNYYFRCKNGKCIPRMHMCEGDDDCGDGSDETRDLCGTGSAPLKCFHCNKTSSSTCSNEVECSRSRGYTRCARFSYISNSSNIIESTCVTKSDCTSEGVKKQCEKRGDGCTMQCCAKNRCNKATTFGNTIWSPSLNCYQCNIHNWEACSTKMTCSGNEGYDRCYTMSYNRIESGKEYHVVSTGCATESNCTGANTLCTGQSNCKLHCCDNSSCNVPQKIETTSKSTIKCYHCSSTKSHQDCHERKVLRTCSDKEDRCYGVQVITDHKNDDGVSRMFQLGCTQANKCNSTTLDVCQRHVKSTSCTVKCCTGHECNTGLSLLVSRFVLMTFAIFAYLCIGIPV